MGRPPLRHRGARLGLLQRTGRQLHHPALRAGSANTPLRTVSPPHRHVTDFSLIGMRVGGDDVTMDAAGRLTGSSESAVPGSVARRLKRKRLLLPAGARVGSP
jgi:hypothetical protein